MSGFLQIVQVCTSVSTHLQVAQSAPAGHGGAPPKGMWAPAEPPTPCVPGVYDCALCFPAPPPRVRNRNLDVAKRAWGCGWGGGFGNLLILIGEGDYIGGDTFMDHGRACFSLLKHEAAVWTTYDGHGQLLDESVHAAGTVTAVQSWWWRPCGRCVVSGFNRPTALR
jgi:hypothetical protein